MKQVYDAAMKHIGLSEISGSKHNPKIVQMFADVGHPQIKDDETSWCAAFVGVTLKSVGLPHTGRLDARSYLKWGDAVDLKDAKQGDVVVFWRVKRDGWQGHVAFFHKNAGAFIEVLGGNQSNKVSIARYSKEQLLGVRRITTKVPAPKPSLWDMILKLLGMKK